jgi:hypothetical protein
MRVHKRLVSLLLAGRDIKDIAFSRLIGCDSFMRLSYDWEREEEEGGGGGYVPDLFVL